MRAWRVHGLEGIGSLAFDEVGAPPAPGPGEATLDMLAVGLNFPDLLMLSGRYQFRPELPFTPGMEGVGRVRCVGEGLAGDLIGQRLLVSARTGLLAEQVTLPLAALRAAPDPLPDDAAAGFTTGFLTAWMALRHRGRLERGEHLLVLGAGGGMGLAAVGLAKALGARVTAAASSPVKLAAAREAGADALLLVDRAAPDLGPIDTPLDLVFDPVGGRLVAPALATLGAGGRYLVIGFAGGPPVSVSLGDVQRAEVAVLGVRAGEAGRRDPALGRRALRDIDLLAERGLVRPKIGLVVPFAETRQAFEAMAAGALVGKAVIRIGEP